MEGKKTCFRGGGAGSSESTKEYPLTRGVAEPTKEASEEEYRGRPAMASLTAERDGEGGTVSDVRRFSKVQVTECSRNQRLLAELAISLPQIVVPCGEYLQPRQGANIKALSGTCLQLSGIAFRESDCSMVKVSGFEEPCVSSLCSRSR